MEAKEPRTPSLAVSSKNPGGLHVPEEYKVKAITKRDPIYVRGGTLERFFRPAKPLSSLPRGCQHFLVYKPPPGMLRYPPCDGCPTQHRSTNLACARSLGVMSRFQNPKLLYSFADRDAQGVPFSVVSSEVPPGAHVSSTIVHIGL